MVTTEPTAAPRTVPAIPMLDEKKRAVAAANAPAPTCIHERSFSSVFRLSPVRANMHLAHKAESYANLPV